MRPQSVASRSHKGLLALSIVPLLGIAALTLVPQVVARQPVPASRETCGGMSRDVALRRAAALYYSLSGVEAERVSAAQLPSRSPLTGESLCLWALECSGNGVGYELQIDPVTGSLISANVLDERPVSSPDTLSDGEDADAAARRMLTALGISSDKLTAVFAAHHTTVFGISEWTLRLERPGVRGTRILLSLDAKTGHLRSFFRQPATSL